MREVLRKRYYCDHCKKGGGTKFHMAKHERGCTLNPDRQCGVCEKIGLSAAPLSELIAFVTSVAATHIDTTPDVQYASIDSAALKTLRERADNCPTCILAALRQAEAFADPGDFDFKKELKSIWADYDGESRYA